MSALTPAVKIPPMCSQPVGDGANLVTSAPAGSERAGYLDAHSDGDGRSAGKRDSVRAALSMAQAYRPATGAGSVSGTAVRRLVADPRPAEPAAGPGQRLVLGDPGGDRVGQPGPWPRPQLLGQPGAQLGGGGPGR